MSRTDKKPTLTVTIPSGTEMVRMYHRNMVENMRALQTPTVTVPSIVARAKMVVRENREVITKESRRRE